MRLTSQRWVKPVVLSLMIAATSSCGLPRVGPNKAEIFKGSEQKAGDSFIVAVDDRVTRATAVTHELAFPSALVNAAPLGSDTIRAGDTLSLNIWENVEDGLLAPSGANSTTLDKVQVDGGGYIFVPYAGRIRAAGNSPEEVRRIITNRLKEQTPDPQVEVNRTAGDGSTVTVVGDSGTGNFPIERPTRTLSAMLAHAGGVKGEEAEITRVTVVRGGHRGTVWFKEIYKNPKNDIALRGGDRILVETDKRTYTILGATGSQKLVPFKSQTLSLIEALAQVGGLSSSTADPTGVFVLRNEPEAIVHQVLGRSDLIGAQRMVYVLDLTQPNGLFTARDFLIRDGDTVYVTEAPFTQWSKTIGSITGAVGRANALNSTVNTAIGN